MTIPSLTDEASRAREVLIRTTWVTGPEEEVRLQELSSNLNSWHEIDFFLHHFINVTTHRPPTHKYPLQNSQLLPVASVPKSCHQMPPCRASWISLWWSPPLLPKMIYYLSVPKTPVWMVWWYLWVTKIGNSQVGTCDFTGVDSSAEISCTVVSVPVLHYFS